MNSLDHDFAHFVRTGEPAALGRVYDAAAAELLALATRLVGNPVEAEDLLQATFVAAIESANGFAMNSRVMPWLVGILNNRVRQHRQARERAVAKASQQGRVLPSTSLANLDALEPPASDATPTQQLESKELDAAVAHAIASLSPLLHPVVVLYLRHGMQPAEIAYALSRPPATVRSQLSRGLADLRQRLPRRHLLPALLLVPTPRGLDAIREAVLQHCAVHTAAIAATTATTIGTVMIMTKKIQLLAAAIVVLAIGSGVYWLPHGESPPIPDSTQQGHVNPATANGAASAAGTTESERSDQPVVRMPIVASHAASLRVTVRTERQPLAGAIVELLPTYVRGHLGQPRRIATDRNGIAYFTTLPWSQGSAMVQGTNATEEWLRKPGETQDIEVVVDEPGWVRGRVLHATGMPLGDAAVWLVNFPYGPHSALDVLRTQADGTFALPVWDSQLIGARAPGMVAVHREVKVKAGENVDIVLQLPAGGATLRGKVYVANGTQPAAGAAVEVGDRLGSFAGRLLPDGSRESVVAQATKANAAGEFVVEGLLPGITSVYAVTDRCAPMRQEVELRSGAVTDVTLRLDKGVRVHGKATLPDGKPAKSATVLVGSGFMLQRANAEHDGFFELPNVPVGMARLVASRLGRTSARHSQVLVADEDFEWNPVLNSRWSQIEGTLLDEHNQPLAEWLIVAHAIRRTVRA